MSRFAWLLGVSLLCVDARAAEADASGPTVVFAQVALDVDATGRVVKAEPDAQLAPVLREPARKAAMGWRFAPITEHGKAVAGTTYANMRLCLVPDGDAFNVAADLIGNGPGTVQSARIPLLPPPPKGLPEGVEFSAKVRYQVKPDGRATLQYAELADPMQQARNGTTWRRHVSQWLSKRRFMPEVVNGTPVATVVDLPLTYELRGLGSLQEVQRKVAERNAEHAQQVCRVAAGEAQNRAVAVDSRFTRAGEG